MVLMPTTLSTTVRHIYDRVPDSMNSKLIEDFHSYMKGNATSERHQNNNLKAVIAFADDTRVIIYIEYKRQDCQTSAINQEV
jgi:hypothetical protein